MNAADVMGLMTFFDPARQRRIFTANDVYKVPEQNREVARTEQIQARQLEGIDEERKATSTKTTSHSQVASGLHGATSGTEIRAHHLGGVMLR
jgi:hypothetical protein